MAENTLAKRAVTAFAVNAAPTIISHVLGGGELSKVTSSICDTIKKVTCKDRIVLEEAIKTLAVMDAPTCNTFMNLLYDAVQVYVQSDCRDYSQIVGWLIATPDATTEEKVQFALMLKQQQHDHRVDTIKVVAKVVVPVIVTYTAKEIGTMLASQAPKAIEAGVKINQRKEETKRLVIRETTNAERHEKDLDADAKRRQANFEQEQTRRATTFAQDQERRKADEERRKADHERDMQRRQANHAQDMDRRKADEEQRQATFERDEKRKQADFERGQAQRQADFEREQKRKQLEAEQRIRAQNK